MQLSASWQSLYPFESHEMLLDGHRYHYLDEGTGEPLLLVHGNPTWSFYWRQMVVAFRGRYRLIVPDHMGCGLSDRPKGYPYRLAQHIENLAALVERLDLRGVTLIAHDWGGAIGIGAAESAPERYRRFVMLNTAAFTATRIPWRIRVCRWPVVGRLAVQGLNAFSRAALTMAVAHRERMTPAVRSGYLAPYDNWSNREAVYRFVEDIPMSPEHPSYKTLAMIEAGLSQFRDRPWQLIWGMRDWCFTPYFMERFLDFFPNAEAHRLADASHYVMEDAPERVIPLVQAFLANHPIAAPVGEA